MTVRKPIQAEIEETEEWASWSKEISTFPWYYDEDESCYILSGSAEVTDHEGRKIQFSEGDWVDFEAGLECTWKISSPLKKRYRLG